jgi:hypothetical protein
VKLSRRRGRRVMWNIWGRREIRTEFWLGNHKDRDDLEELSVNKNIILKYALKKQDRNV